MEANINTNINIDSNKINIVDLKFVDPNLLETLFQQKAEKMKTSNKLKLDNETKLKFYGLFKVATVGPISEINKKSVGMFDFTEKYKNQAWEKCSKLSKEDAMIEYIKLYNKLTGENEDEILKTFNKTKEENEEEDKDFLDFESLNIPNDFETTQSVSTNAKHSKKELDEFLLKSSDSEKLFYKIKEKFYSGDIMSASYLKDFSKNNNFDLSNCRDTNGQTLLHVAVDSMNNSAVETLVELNLAQVFLNVQDNYGMTPMHIAAINFDYEIFNYLCSLKPNYHISDTENKTPLDYLKENEDIEEDIKNSLENINL